LFDGKHQALIGAFRLQQLKPLQGFCVLSSRAASPLWADTGQLQLQRCWLLIQLQLAAAHTMEPPLGQGLGVAAGGWVLTQ
jgi:hypothetical protein